MNKLKSMIGDALFFFAVSVIFGFGFSIGVTLYAVVAGLMLG